MSVEFLTLNMLVSVYNNAQVLLGREPSLQKFTDRVTGLKRIEKARQELINMHGYAEVHTDLTWIIERPLTKSEVKFQGAPKLKSIIHVLCDKNPKTLGSRAWKVFELYENPMTCQQLYDKMTAAGYSRTLFHGTLRYDLERKYIRLEEVS